MSIDNKNIKLSMAATGYLATLPREKSEFSQQELYKFVRWYSEDKRISGLTHSEVASYAEHVSAANTDYTKKLEVIKTFLSYARKEGWIKENLAVSLKARKTKIRVQAPDKTAVSDVVSLTQDGYNAMKTELEELQKKRFEVIDAIRRAAADKDLKENAPYHAAREHKSYLDGKIMELEETLKNAVIVVVGQNNTLKANIGDTITLKDLASNEEMSCILVNPREVDPRRGMFSSSSPIGKALIGHGQGEIIEITVPSGKIRYQIEEISH